jgi:hypothetical protein
LKDKAREEYSYITLEDLFLCKAEILPYTSSEESYPEIESSASIPGLIFIEYLIKQAPA